MEKIKDGIRTVVLIGGSAGSLDPLFSILTALPDGYAHPVVVVLHRGSAEPGLLTGLLASRTRQRITEIEDKDSLRAGGIFLAPPDYHLLFEQDGCLSLDDSEKVAFSRPSIDVAFQSAAAVYRDRLTGILLSGANTDGTEGLREIGAGGGAAIAQRPESAAFPFMPRHAIDRGAAGLVLDPTDIARYLLAL